MHSIQQNPFKVDTELVAGEYFADRTKEQKDLQLRIDNGERIVLFSYRRYGKTALLTQVLRNSEAKGMIAKYVDVSTVPDLKLFIRKYFSTFVPLLSKSFVRDWIARNLAKVKVTYQDFGLDFSGLADADVHEALDRCIDLPQELAKARRTRVVVVLDEFHDVRNFDAGTVEKIIRSKIQFHPGVSYVFSGSKRSIMQDMFETNSDSPFYHSAKSMELGKIDGTEYAGFVKRMMRGSGIEIADDVIAQALEFTRVHTYYSQILFHEMWNVCKAGGIVRVTDGVFRKVLDTVVHDNSALYEEKWGRLPVGYRRFLRMVLVEGGKNIWSRRAHTAHSLTVGNVQYALKYLADDGTIEKDGAAITVSDAFFARWLEQKLGISGSQAFQDGTGHSP